MTTRTPLVARAASIADLDALAQLCLAARSETSISTSVCPPEPERVRAHMRALFGEAGVRITVVPEHDPAPPAPRKGGRQKQERAETPSEARQVAGFAISRTVPPGLFTDEPRVQIEAIYVAPTARRRGAGHALLGAIAVQAADANAAEVVCLPLIGSRSLQRFFARIGFAPIGSYRLIATDTLARRVIREPAVVAERAERRRGLEELIAQRRRRRDTGEIPLPPYEAGDKSRNKQVRRAVASRRPLSSS